ncbi:MAG: hypothetical protein KDB31_02760 [Microthrixaceae bacterium]|nr:hypothetical protein [Microthrixaceae bacterium]
MSIRRSSTGSSNDPGGSNRSLGVVAVLVLVAVAALVAWFPGRSEVAGTQVLRAPVSASVGDEGGSWYCAARDMGVADVEFDHQVFVASLGEAESNLRVEGFSGDQREGSTDITLDAGATAVVNVREAFGSAALSVMVESDRPVSVEHRISFDGGADQSPCSTFSSDTWYFPTAVTTRDATASLNLFNPFPGDASVNIQVALETGVRVPDRLNGLVVPAGSTLVVELGEHVERREQFAFTVSARSGGVVAELVQRFDGSNDDHPVTGLRMVPGSRRPAAGWSFAGGFADPSARERLVVQNPTEPEVDVLAQPVVSGATDVMPEPFELTAPALRFAVVDVDADSRVPVAGFHAIDVEADGDHSVVAARSLDVNGVPEGAEGVRTGIEGGTTASSGLPVAAADWVLTGVQHREDIDGVVLVHNPTAEAAVVSVVALTAAGPGEPVEYELPPGDLVGVGLDSLGGTEEPFSVSVSSDSPVVVERLIVFSGIGDLSLQPGVPVVDDLDDLEPLG